MCSRICCYISLFFVSFSPLSFRFYLFIYFFLFQIVFYCLCFIRIFPFIFFFGRGLGLCVSVSPSLRVCLLRQHSLARASASAMCAVSRTECSPFVPLFSHVLKITEWNETKLKTVAAVISFYRRL